jgi:uncharacterized FlaG/YvyC family protein
MINPVAHIPASTPPPPPRDRRPDRIRPVEAAAAYSGVPKDPPREVLEALDRAQQVLRELADSRVDLKFALEQEATGKRVRVEVRNGAGELVREIPPKRLLDILAGDTRGLIIDTKG